MMSGGATQCVFNVAEIVTSRNRLHCLTLCLDMGDRCSGVTYSHDTCEISHTADLSECFDDQDGSYGTFIYKSGSALGLAGDQAVAANITVTENITTPGYGSSTVEYVEEVLNHDATRHNYSLALGM